MKQQVENFMQKLKADPALAERLRALKTKEEIIEFVKPHLDGLSPEEFYKEIKSSIEKGEISADDLYAVSGGSSLGDFAAALGGVIGDEKGEKMGRLLGEGANVLKENVVDPIANKKGWW